MASEGVFEMNRSSSGPMAPEELQRFRGPSIERRRLPPRTTCLALILLTLGITLFICALISLGIGHDGAIPLFLLSALTLIPGGYVSFHLLGVVRRWPGFEHLDSITDVELV
uniref:Transmembrane protein 230 n=1 Tax=Aureoumbra lagunensis TaxID=44058 RepID=A0A7S3NIZ1_9STRA